MTETTEDIKPSELFHAERELRTFAKSMKAVMALADQIGEVGDLHKLAAETQTSIEALRRTEEEQRAQTEAITAENDGIKVKIAEHKQRVATLSNEARAAEAARDEAQRATEQARQDLENATAEHAVIDSLRKNAARERDEALRASTEAKAIHQDLTAKIATIRAQIAGLGVA